MKWLEQRRKDLLEEGSGEIAQMEEQARLMGEVRDVAVAVLVVTPVGIPLVWDPRKARPRNGVTSPVYWKLPGGKGVFPETPEEAGRRELREETGVDVPEDSLSLILREERTSHDYLIFRTDLDEAPELIEEGDEGEKVATFPLEVVLRMQDILPSHRQVIQRQLRSLVA